MWTVGVDAPNPKEWTKVARSYEKGVLESLLATARQEIKKKVHGLETVRWAVPEALLKAFKDPEPRQTQEETKGPGRRRNSGARFEPPSKDEAIPLSEITGGEKKKVTVFGRVCEVNWRQNQAGRFDGTFTITDMMDSLRVRLPYQEAKREDIEVGRAIVARGRTDVARFDGDPLIVVTNYKDICLAEIDVRPTLAEKRVELHLHTKMIAMDAVLDLERAVARAKEW